MSNYIKKAKNPPKSKEHLSSPEALISRLRPLIGKSFPLTGKSRTDGSNFRKLVTNTLLEQHIPKKASDDTYEIFPANLKGVPKFLREAIDTYIVTSGSSYNLQVWNRNPTSSFVQVQYHNSEPLYTSDVRFVIGKINVSTHTIESIAIMTPQYIANKFGSFGKPTIKQQLIISNNVRNTIISSDSRIAYCPDDVSLQNVLTTNSNISTKNIKADPDNILSLETIYSIVKDHIIGLQLDPKLATKNRGQELERLLAQKIGYKVSTDSLDGGYPDIRNQMLEIKIQDSPTVDLGKYSPQFCDDIYDIYNTENIRYLIALSNAKTGVIEGAILCPGNQLGSLGTYVANKSFKCQRSIPMEFFEAFSGQVVYNP